MVDAGPNKEPGLEDVDETQDEAEVKYRVLTQHAIIDGNKYSSSERGASDGELCFGAVMLAPTFARQLQRGGVALRECAEDDKIEVTAFEQNDSDPAPIDPAEDEADRIRNAEADKLRIHNAEADQRRTNRNSGPI